MLPLGFISWSRFTCETSRTRQLRKELLSKEFIYGLLPSTRNPSANLHPVERGSRKVESCLKNMILWCRAGWMLISRAKMLSWGRATSKQLSWIIENFTKWSRTVQTFVWCSSEQCNCSRLSLSVPVLFPGDGKWNLNHRRHLTLALSCGCAISLMLMWGDSLPLEVIGWAHANLKLCFHSVPFQLLPDGVVDDQFRIPGACGECRVWCVRALM